MTLVVVERTFEQPLTQSEVIASIRGGAWCNDVHGITHLGSALAPDGMRAVCFYRAPDAEAVRSTSQRLRVPYDRVWSATLHGPVGPEPLTMQPLPEGSREPAGTTVVVGRSFDAPMEFAALQAQEDAKAWCLDAHGVRFLQSLFSFDRRRMLCLYAAPDAEAVRFAQRKAGLPFDAVWAAALCSP